MHQTTKYVTVPIYNEKSREGLLLKLAIFKTIIVVIGPSDLQE